MAAPPSGTITFLFTDIEGSSRLWERHAGAMAGTLARHDAILRNAIAAHVGYVFKTIGDAFCAAFSTAQDALGAAMTAQRAFAAAAWEETGPPRVRMALHTGAAEQRDGDYFGPTLNRVARLLAAAHGGQTLLSQVTQELVRDALPPGVSLRDLGERRLKDLARPERIFQATAAGLPSDFPPLRSLESFPNNLPAQLTSFIGREQAMADVKQLLHTAPLLTLTGTGGTGKTRLSLQVATEMLDQFPDGVWLAEFATISDPDLVPETVAPAVGLREEPGRPAAETLPAFMRGKAMLLIFDNCEHVVAACARLAERLLQASPHLQILASSREPLGIAGEKTWHVPPLSLPEHWRGELGSADTAEKLSQFEAVRLFIDRATAVHPAFQVTNENAPAVAEICWRLDGIPLAIELAAARVKVLSVEQIAGRLNDRFHLLTHGSRTAMPRQQTLRALIDWSYDLLTEPERVLLCRLAVFGRGRTLEAVEAVCAGDGVEEWEILDLLTQLVDKSLVTVEKAPGHEPRYTLLESVWDYSREKLAASGERDVLRARHLDFFIAFAEKAERELCGRSQQEWVRRCELEEVNFRLALRASIRLPGCVEKGLRLASALQRYWEMRSLLKEGGEIYADLLGHPEAAARTPARAKTLAAAGRLAWIADDLANGARWTSEALEIFRELSDTRATAETLGDLALFRWDARDCAAAKAMLDEADALAAPLADKRLCADLLSTRAVLASAEHRHADALALSEKALRLYIELGDEWSTDGALWAVAISAALLRDFEKARASLDPVLRNVAATRNHWSLPYSLEAFAAVAAAEGQFPRAARLLGAAEALREQAGLATAPSDHPAMRELLATAADALTAPECLAARHEGRAMSERDAVDFALERENEGSAS